MVDIRSKTQRIDGVTLVSVTVTNPRQTAQRIRLQSQLDGPTWPPRDGRLPFPEWDGDCWQACIRPGASRGIGFASPAEPTEPPMTLVSMERVADDASETVEQVLTDLDGWTPPEDIVGETE